MDDIAELESRINAAMRRIGHAIEDSLGGGTAPAEELSAARAEAQQSRDEAAAAAQKAEDAEAEIARLKEALAAESDGNAELRDSLETLETASERQQARIAELEAEATAMAGQRAADRAELDELIAALEPLVREVSDA